MAVVLKWKGTGYIVGVPARDLTDADLAALKLDAAALVAGGAYEYYPEKTGDHVGGTLTLPDEDEKAATLAKEDKARRRKYADKAASED